MSWTCFRITRSGTDLGLRGDKSVGVKVFDSWKCEVRSCFRLLENQRMYHLAREILRTHIAID